MNVSKKIKPPRWPRAKLHLALALFLPLFAINAQTNAQTPAPYKVRGAESLTPGYVTLLTDYSGVKQKMLADVARGNGAMWRTWMDPGLKRNETLYWWLLADFLAANGKPDEAYKAAIQALVFMKVELSSCGGNSKHGRTFSNGMLQSHASIITATVQQQTIKTAVLEAITRTDNLLTRNQVLPGMSCQLLDVQKQKTRPADLTINLAHVQPTDRRFAALLSVQTNSLKRIKSELSYDKIWKSADSNLIWNLRQID